jgi:hypothetical protein
MNNFGEIDGGDTITNNDGCRKVKYVLTHKAINTVNSFLNKPAYEARILGKGEYPLHIYI